MKPAAGILALIWTFVLVQPAFAHFGGRPAYGACCIAAEKKTACSKGKTPATGYLKKKPENTGCTKGKCNTPSKTTDNTDCRSNGCNPSLGCASGNFFLHYHSRFTLAAWTVLRPQPVITNDNRIVKIMSECWHPPEA